MNENPPRNLILGRLVAIAANNEPIVYSIVESSNPQFAFGIKKDNGDIFINNSTAVDYEKQSTFVLGVIATIHNANNTHSSHLTVLINLTDINDNVPQFAVKSMRHPYTETNDKNFYPTYIHQFLVQDADKNRS